MSIFTPINQVKLTNVAIVRHKRAGKRFEIACYKNKVLSWRDKSETDIDEVLQIHDIFTNVSKGQVAKSADLNKAFSEIIKNVAEREQKTAICKFILQKGDLQVSQKERQAANEEMFTEIANIVATMAVDTETQRAISVSTILQVMKEELHYSLRPNSSAKRQALIVLNLLKENCEDLNIDRANMRLEITAGDSKTLKLFLSENAQLVASVEETDYASGSSVILAQPGHLSSIQEKINQMTRGRGDVDVLELNAVDTEEIDI